LLFYLNKKKGFHNEIEFKSLFFRNLLNILKRLN
jgi:hypothetical protein